MTHKWPKISIVTPSYNQGQFIEETIVSVLEQDYPNLEYIIIDGGSTDNTIEIVRKYEKHLTYWHSKPDKGQTDAINQGFEMATGDIFNWINSDDYYLPESLQKVATLFKENEHVMSVSGREIRIDEQRRFVNRTNGPTLGGTMNAMLYPHIDQPSTFFRLSSIADVFPLNVDLKYCMCQAMWLKYLNLHGLDNHIDLDTDLVVFRYHRQSKTISNGLNFRDELWNIRFELASNIQVPKERSILNAEERISYSENLHILKTNENTKKQFQLTEMAGRLAYLNLIREARKCAWLAIKLSPFKILSWKVFLSLLLRKRKSSPQYQNVYSPETPLKTLK